MKIRVTSRDIEWFLGVGARGQRHFLRVKSWPRDLITQSAEFLHLRGVSRSSAEYIGCGLDRVRA